MSEAPDAGDEPFSSEDINVSIGAGVPRKPRKSKPELTEPEA